MKSLKTTVFRHSGLRRTTSFLVVRNRGSYQELPSCFPSGTTRNDQERGRSEDSSVRRYSTLYDILLCNFKFWKRSRYHQKIFFKFSDFEFSTKKIFAIAGILFQKLMKMRAAQTLSSLYRLTQVEIMFKSKSFLGSRIDWHCCRVD